MGIVPLAVVPRPINLIKIEAKLENGLLQESVVVPDTHDLALSSHFNVSLYQLSSPTLAAIMFC